MTDAQHDALPAKPKRDDAEEAAERYASKVMIWWGGPRVVAKLAFLAGVAFARREARRLDREGGTD